MIKNGILSRKQRLSETISTVCFLILLKRGTFKSQINTMNKHYEIQQPYVAVFDY